MLGPTHTNSHFQFIREYHTSLIRNWSLSPTITNMSKLRLLVIFLLAKESISQSSNNNAQQPDAIVERCSLCRDGAAMGNPGRLIPNLGVLGGLECVQIDDLLGRLYPNSSHPECQSVQALGTMCGCPEADNTCSLCPNGNKVSRRERELPFLQDLFAGLIPNCEMMEAYFLSTENSTGTGLCLVAQDYMADYCGCYDDDDDDNEEPPRDENEQHPPCSLCATSGTEIAFPDKQLGLEDFPFDTCADLQNAAGLLLQHGTEQCSNMQELGAYCGCPTELPLEESCSFCPDGSPVLWPDKAMTHLADIGIGFSPTCSMAELSLRHHRADSSYCELMQMGSSFCGCPPVDNHCNYCPELEDVPPEYAKKQITQFSRHFGDSFPRDITCENIWLTQYQLPSDDERCYFARRGSYLCGCNGGESNYLNADTRTKKLVLAWTPRISGIFSILVRKENAA